MSRFIAALDQHWFALGSPRDLAIVRILAFGTQTLFFILFPGGYLRSLSEQLDRVSVAADLYKPILALKLLLLPWGWREDIPPTVSFLIGTFVVAVVAGVFATIGLYARVAMPLAAAANALLVAHYYSYGEFHHAEALMIIALHVLAIAPSAAVWSVDAARARRRQTLSDSESSPDIRALVRWPLRLMQWLLALSYLSAAGSKLYHSGISWMNGYTLTYHFLTVALLDETELAFFFASLPPRAYVLPSMLTLVFELTFPVAILVPRTAWLYVVAGTCLHVGIYVTMGVAFFQTIVLYSVFIESLRHHSPSWLGERIGSGHAARPLS